MMKQIFELNNAAVGMMLAGDNEAAQKNLQQAFLLLKALVVSQQQQQQQAEEAQQQHQSTSTPIPKTSSPRKFRHDEEQQRTAAARGRSEGQEQENTEMMDVGSSHDTRQPRQDEDDAFTPAPTAATPAQTTAATATSTTPDQHHDDPARRSMIYYSPSELPNFEDAQWALNRRPILFDVPAKRMAPSRSLPPSPSSSSSPMMISIENDSDDDHYYDHEDGDLLDVQIAVILFNLALIYHRIALTRTSPAALFQQNAGNQPHANSATTRVKQTALSKASSLYAISCKLSRAQCQLQPSAPVSACAATMMLVAASNNLAHLQFLQGDSQAGKATFTDIVFILEHVRSGMLPQSLGRELTDIYLNMFTFNTIISASAA
eukprot:CAMPEP_0119551874 /NCGR_PEP_ID=MMETSP1352-20130426/5000_1 /TAXON_ID=265584 /ORGANISM="Stauroneis constricta, Strain CCMP1120" /LENGTH=375 /DNA_ID=CAMNT_0007597995 /DNA_START=42 /DNA_END=1169 /DNA_ORIENTATION=-